MTDVRLHITDSGGEGRPVVLIHGWPLSGESWKAQRRALTAAGYRVVDYDRRGFGESDKPETGYDYDTFADDLQSVLTDLDLVDVTLVGFSMGGGEVARYLSRHGESRVRSVVFAAAVTPYMHKTDDNPDGPLDDELYGQLRGGLVEDRDAFFDDFVHGFFSVGDDLKVGDGEIKDARELAQQSSQTAAVGAMDAWATTDFRPDLPLVTVPTLVIHGSGDGTVPFEGSGARTHAAIPHSQLVVIDDAPHGLNVSHADEFNAALLAFLGDEAPGVDA
ncbi:alpha/beta fold hydrolase [Agrococcus jejuensis]|uniref:Pimeloyl-ACP methyl ester carboxylesterase n=1 Tax=Agrococcus jejuensis TaxID=399736 RepID=A0A1G8GC07_9MICO|nr:alpha/beta hydrolase [Agrococcus jejuensis]SDH91883.1 Pimeloyl-ACP methyl ester carboxylesterase [Agrococcus jejuensis]